jgi:phage protein D/phage baseplate assembly protein gpV
MPAEKELISQIYLKIDGADAPEEMTDNLIYIEVDDNLNLADMFTINLRDPELKWIDSDTFAVGKSVEISTRGDNGQVVKLITGEITSVESRFASGAGATLVVCGYDQSHRLNRGKQTKTFVQMTDSDMATKIAREIGLKAEVEPTREVYEYVLQDNQTNLEFLQGRAKRIGYRVFVEEGTLYFRPAPQEAPQVPVLEWEVNLNSVETRLTTSQQIKEVVVRGWSPSGKKDIVGRATRTQETPEIGETQKGGELAQKAFGSAGTEVVVNRPVSTQAEADALAQSVCDEIGGDFIQAEGICGGNPNVQAGAMVELKGLSTRFSGRYRVTHAMHRYDAKGYHTHFAISGRHANTIGEILTGGRNSNGHSVVVGVVTNNQDPEGQGRVKVRFPWLADQVESQWARVASPMAGKDRGMFFLPEVNDEVVVAFEQGDMNYPYVLGALWNGVDNPPETNSDGKNNIRKITSRSGHEIIFGDDDTTRKEKVEIHTKAGHRILLDDSAGQEKIEIKDKTGNNAIKMDSMQNSIDISSAMKLKIKAQTVEIEAGAMMTVKAGATLTIQGTMVKIN